MNFWGLEQEPLLESVWCVEVEEGQNISQWHGVGGTDRGCTEKKQGEVKFLILGRSISISTIWGGVSTLSKEVNEQFP